MGTIFDLSTIGTGSNQITFNDPTGTIYYRITDRYGINRQIRQFDIPLPEEMGVADFQTLMGRSDYILKGVMYPQDETTYDIGKKALRKIASLDIEQSDPSSDQGYVPYKFSDSDGYNKEVNLKVLYADIRENSRSGLKLPYILFCKVKFPVIQSQTAITANVGNATSTATGASGLPWLLPLGLGLTTYSSGGSINNPGDLPCYPSFVIFGPISVPRLTNTTTGGHIELNVNLPSSSDSLIISYDQDTTAITQGGVSVYGSLTSGSTLFKLKSGTNNLTLTGSTVGSGAFATISTFPIWPLS